MSYAGKININNVDYPIASSLYGECTTVGATAAKVVTLANFDALIEGVQIAIKFTYSNTAASPTLNVNATGAKAIKTSNGGTPGTTVTTSWRAGSVVSFIYSGGYWVIVNSVTESISAVETSISNEVSRATGAEGTITTALADKEPKLLRFTNKSATFTSGNGITNFTYRAEVACDGVTSGMIPYVSFSGNDAGSGDYAPYCQAYDGGVYLYADIGGTITIPSIVCWRS